MSHPAAEWHANCFANANAQRRPQWHATYRTSVSPIPRDPCRSRSGMFGRRRHRVHCRTETLRRERHRSVRAAVLGNRLHRHMEDGTLSRSLCRDQEERSPVRPLGGEGPSVRGNRRALQRVGRRAMRRWLCCQPSRLPVALGVYPNRDRKSHMRDRQCTGRALSRRGSRHACLRRQDSPSLPGWLRSPGARMSPGLRHAQRRSRMRPRQHAGPTMRRRHVQLPVHVLRRRRPRELRQGIFDLAHALRLRRARRYRDLSGLTPHRKTSARSHRPLPRPSPHGALRGPVG